MDKITWKKVWHFIWDDDSIWSWLVNVVLAFILIKFIVYPGLGFLLGTSYPIVAVVSGSMEHDGNFETWWSSSATCTELGCTQSSYYMNLGIGKEEFEEFHFKNGFNTGDIMILRGTPPDKLEVGDVIVYQSTRPDPIIHRIVKIWYEDGKYYFQTKGDHNLQVFPFEQRISEDYYIGKSAIRLPYLGWIKLIFVKIIGLVI